MPQMPQTLSIACPRHEGKRIYYHLAPCPFNAPHECSYEGCTDEAVTAIYFHDANPSFPCVCRKHENPDTWQWLSRPEPIRSVE